MTAYRGEGGAEIGAKRRDGRDYCHRNQGGDETIFERGHTAFVASYGDQGRNKTRHNDPLVSVYGR
jgi:hypothetical protein